MNLKIMYQLREEIATQMPSLNKWQRENLAMFALGVVKAEHCVQSKVARALRRVGKRASIERRMQRFMDNDHLSLENAQEEWSRWVLKAWGGQEVILLVDETHLGENMRAMVVGIAYEGRCIPLAWQCYQAETYPEEGQVKLITQLLQRIKTNLPETICPLIQADRGIGTSPDLIREVMALGWRYLFRVQGSSKMIEEDGRIYALGQVIGPGEVWEGSGTVFKKRGQIAAHVRVIWDENQKEPWSLVTNDPTLTGREYALRNWQEQGFRDLKSGGWQWNHSHVWMPDHADRLLLVLTLAYAWVLSLGSYFIHTGHAAPLRTERDGRQRRRLSVFREGLEHLDQMIRRRHIVCLKLLFVPDKRLGP